MKIGIDLGTTNSELAYIDPSEVADSDFPHIHFFEAPQYVDQGLIEPRRTLPSFVFLGDQNYIGVYAREQGALVPTRVVHSAKSWLSNPDVDRTAKILPWDAQESGRVFSPVEVSAQILGYFRQAWDQAMSSPLAEQDVVITVPASFDEEARELTVEAAHEAGLQDFTLIEEPAAAFYSWIANHLAESRKNLFEGQLVLVCDVGGGTSDFTLIRVSRDGDKIDFTRTAVGRHLLLGGDNLDLTLAWLVETKLGVPLSVRQRSALRRQCATAKERLLSDPRLTSVEITVLGAGAALVGGTLKTEILQQEVLELALEGFLPFCSLTDKPKEERRSLFRELGLPYVSDPAITRHLASFLVNAGAEASGGPDAILFNGGFFIPNICCERVADVVEHWYGAKPLVLDNRDLDLAVAAGATYYSYVRSTGRGLLVRGGLPRSYYLGIGGGQLEGEGNVRSVCLVPRGTEDGTILELDREDLQLVANRPVSFRLYSSLTRTDESLGQVVEFTPEQLESEIHLHAPLHAVIRFGKRTGDRLVPVRLAVRLTEVGTLEIWCESKISEHRWRLRFELRKSAPAETEKEQPQRPGAVISEEAVQQAVNLIESAFSAREESPVTPEELPGKLEQVLALGRNSWPLDTIRKLADVLLDAAESRRKSAAWEARWLNLSGFCLRPGLGYPGDDWRIEQARRIYASGLQFANQVQNGIEWWIFWGRVAGGLNRNQQVDLYQRLSSTLLPGRRKQKRINASLLREMCRTAAGLELLPLKTKTDLGEALLQKARSGDLRQSDLWCLSRIGARRLLYGPINQVLPPAIVTRWVETLLSRSDALDAIVAISHRTGDSTRDLSPRILEMVRRRVGESPERARLLPILEGEQPRGDRDLTRIFGEELPTGLVFAESEQAHERTPNP
jgi:hypothetical protein